MANRTVEIRCDEQGQYSVGVEPEQDEGDGRDPSVYGGGGVEPAEGDYLKPVKSLDDALSVARDLFQGATGAQSQQAEKQFKAGFQGGVAAQEAQGY